MKIRTAVLAFAGFTTMGLGLTERIARAADYDDGGIVMQTKMAMWTTPGVPSLDVDVDSLDGRVVLHGKVETTAQRDAAERAARTVAGVREVRNLVQVVPERLDDAVEDKDEIIDKHVKSAFADERGLKGTQIKVGSVNKGVVLLIGKARTLSEHVLAVETAHSIKGVRYVATQVSGPRGYTEDELAGGRADMGTASSSGTHHGHAYITTAVKLRLLADSAVPALDISVDSRGGMVILFGTVPTDAARAAAEADARKVSGVDRVLNDLQVVPASERKEVAVKDGQVQDSVKKAIETRDELKKVDVEVKNGVVRLTGFVPSEPSRLKAAILARSTSGVHSVDNDILIKHK